MLRTTTLVVSVLLGIASGVTPLHAADTGIVEVGSGYPVVSSNIFTPGNLESGAYYNASGIVVGSEFRMYVQGGQWDANPGCPGRDSILLFKTPYTDLGLRQQFSYHSRINSCTGNAYGIGNVFLSRGKYNIVADETPDTLVFEKLVLFSSTTGDGAWTSEPFIRHTLGPSFYLLDMVLYAQSDSLWWGFFRFGYDSPSHTGRVKISTTTSGTRTYQVWWNNSWRTLSKQSNEGLLDFEPQSVASDMVVNDIYKNGTTYEAWGYANVPHNGCAPCEGPYDNGPFGSTIRFRTTTQTTFGPLRLYGACDRCMPSDSYVGRLFPSRGNGPTWKYLFSSTRDLTNCDDLFNAFAGMYVVANRIYQPGSGAPCTPYRPAE